MIREDAKILGAPVEYETFLQNIDKKDIYLFSVNLEGIGLSKRLRALGLNVKGFVDSRYSTPRKSLPVFDPDIFFSNCNPSKQVLIVCTKDREWKKNVIERARSHLFIRYQNLYTPLDICRFFPTIEIAGKCNLRCRTCDMGLPGANKGRGHMNSDIFESVLDKMTREIPLMNSVALYTWGEPLLNPEIPQIIKICNKYGVATEISSNLEYQKNLEEFLLAGPDQIIAPCSGVGERYERGRTGGTWANYLKALKVIASIKEKHNLDYNVRIMYHLYKDNLYDDLDYMRKLAAEYNFTLIPIVAHLFPGRVYDFAINGIEIPEIMKEASKDLIFSIDDQLNFVKSKINTKCHIINAFPTVSWDCKVLHCCNMQWPTVGDFNFLETPLKTFIEKRNSSTWCTNCMNKGIHRFFDVNIKLEDKNGKRHIQRI